MFLALDLLQSWNWSHFHISVIHSSLPSLYFALIKFSSLLLTPLVSPLFTMLTLLHLGSAPECLPSLSFSHHILSSLPRNCLHWSLSSQSLNVNQFYLLCSPHSAPPLPSHPLFCFFLRFILLLLFFFILVSPTMPALLCFLPALPWLSIPIIFCFCHIFWHLIKLSILTMVNLPDKTPFPTFDFRHPTHLSYTYIVTTGLSPLIMGG